MSNRKIAIVCANGLGDGLLSLTMAHNLAKKYQVTTFSNYMTQMQGWFPDKEIKAFPAADNIDQTFADYDQIISTDGAFLARMQHNLGERHQIFYERDFNKKFTVLENFLLICQQQFAITETTKSNGIIAPFNLRHRYYKNRVIIHPMSTSDKKNWLPEKFIHLAKKLKHRNFEPVFVVSPKEQPGWEKILGQQFMLNSFMTVDQLANFVYESGYMIGNDSGIGHLAANLNIPTLSLFARSSVANLWRPAWGKGLIVTPSFQLPGARLRTKYWKNFLTVNKVLKFFEKLSQGE